MINVRAAGDIDSHCANDQTRVKLTFTRPIRSKSRVDSDWLEWTVVILLALVDRKPPQGGEFCRSNWSHTQGMKESHMREFLDSDCTFSRLCLTLAVLPTKCWKRDISNASERAFPRVFGGFFCYWTPSKKGVFCYARIHSLLVNWCHHSFETRALTCPFKQSTLSAWSLLSWLHTSDGDSMFFFKSNLLSTVTATPSRSFQ